FGLEEKFGMNAILIQMLPFVILHNGKPFVETLSAIIGAILLGYIAIRTRSIFYGVAIHFILFFSMDLFVVLMN
ncbi:MAG: CPBP family intramembrane metalloprotease, partial [Melioribacteraceae bacterium]